MIPRRTAGAVGKLVRDASPHHWFNWMIGITASVSSTTTPITTISSGSSIGQLQERGTSADNCAGALQHRGQLAGLLAHAANMASRPESGALRQRRRQRRLQHHDQRVLGVGAHGAVARLAGACSAQNRHAGTGQHGGVGKRAAL